ncbi:MAG: hypothetical protein ABR991_11745 [Terracidiphilus sp.]
MDCALLAAPVAAIAAGRGPSTPEERKHALEYIHDFQVDPLNPKVNPEREWVLQWIIEIPDVHVHMCADLLDKLPKENKKDSSTILIAEMFAQPACRLQNSDKQDDRLVEDQAGVEGALQVYEVLLNSNPKDRQPFLEDLIPKRDSGTLAQWVKERDAAQCNK